MITQKVGGLDVGDVIRVGAKRYEVTGVEWSGRHDCSVYVSDDEFLDYRLPLDAGDNVELVWKRGE